MHEKRLTTRLVDYWNLIRKEQPIPPIQKFNSSAMSDLWQNCFQLSVQPIINSQRTYIYDHFGKKIAEAYGVDMKGKVANTNMRQFPGVNLIRRVDELTAKPEVLLEEGQFINDKSKVIKFRACLLPFGTEAGVTHIIAGLSWQSF